MIAFEHIDTGTTVCIHSSSLQVVSYQPLMVDKMCEYQVRSIFVQPHQDRAIMGNLKCIFQLKGPPVLHEEEC